MKDQKYQEKTDEELVLLALSDQDCFLYLMRRYEKKLLAYILRISNINQDEAEDILQDTFIKIYENLNDFDTELKFSSWAYRITHNQVISNYRKIKSRPQNIPLDINEEILGNLASSLDVKKDLDALFLRENIEKVLANLDIKYREILILKFLEEKNYKEISDILKKPMGTIATLINRAKKEFKKELLEKNIKI
ncbi:MAG: RNA polymerase sigma factor [Patescibacteria group bacterium]|jgi:RNA polymerase sigma-70 factor (ECF subfamily)